MLEPLRRLFPAEAYPRVISGLADPDDAAVWLGDDGTAYVLTVDYFLPVVDDPETYGRIAAVNALSDVWAMGGEPLLALNLAALPADMPAEIKQAILRGGAEEARKAGIPIAGGHSVETKEPAYGLIVFGRADPARLLRKRGARPGDLLLLTKALGTGVITTAAKRGQDRPGDLAAAVKSMLVHNAGASRAALAAGAHAVTDVTGFGLLGHLWEMAQASGVGFVVETQAIPWLPGAEAYGADWVFPGGAHKSYAHVRPHARFADGLEEWRQVLLTAPETSGGLLVALDPADLGRWQETAASEGVRWWRIGRALPAEAEPFLAVTE